ncbi:MAG: tRNA (adenosine(37)-N6)-dimethylallyltransferase MiaA [Gammaproteobacteria bacterium]|nr:tRNA (adenosine(37)-N6)-dimethylallyltransferase MiaA [Gammaproteobacteria bacterium]
MHDRPVIFLMGPTASGKTDLAAALFDRHDAELVSVDAAQVYRGMDIGTAKPARDLLRRYPHHLIDIRAPHETWSAAEFRDHALTLIGHIHARGKLPILVGGSMFYFSALENGLSELPAADPGARARISREMEQRGPAAMHKRLQRIDAALAAAIRPSDPQRIQRALEIHRLTGCAPSEVMRRSAARRFPFPLIKLGLFTADRRVLHARIETRFRRMLARGLVGEVEAIAATLGDAGRQPSMRTVGYRQVLGFLRNELTYDEMTAKGVAATRQLAKRQLTWLRQQSNLVWVDASARPPVDSVCVYLQKRIEMVRGRAAG